MSAIINDSNFSTNYGTVYLPVTGSAITGTFLAENLTVTVPAQTIDLRNNLNEPAGRILIADFVNGSATLQVTGVFPSIGSTFGFKNNVYYFAEVGESYAQGDIYKANVNFNKKYN